MRVGDFCRSVATAERDDTVLDVARIMRQQGVREVVVVAREGGRRRPLGVLTDREIVTELVAEQRDLEQTPVCGVMDTGLQLLHEDEGLSDAIAMLRSIDRRCLPVVNGLGDLVGLLTRDHVLEFLGEQFAGLLSLGGEVEVCPWSSERGGESRGRSPSLPMD